MLALVLALQVAAGTASDSVLATVRNFVRVSDRLATSGQIDSAHIKAIAREGFDLVVNLATARAEQNGTEGFAVAEQGLTYVNIPVSWEQPSLDDLDMFFAVMRANRDNKVFVHCFANMRASAFTYLYRTLVAGDDESAARADMQRVWDPETDERYPQWGEFVRAARARAGR